MKRRSKILWLSVLVLGWLFDFLFWRQSPGLNFALYVLLCLIGGFLILSLDGKRISALAMPLVVLILFFASVPIWRTEPLTLFVSVSMTLLLMALLAISFLDGGWLRHTLFDHLRAFLRLAISVLVEPLTFKSEVQKERAEAGLSRSRLNPWPLVRGTLLAIPALLVFGALLASADVVFGREMDRFIQLLGLEHLPEYVFRLAYILAAAYALAGVFLHAAGYGRAKGATAKQGSNSLRLVGFTEVAILLGSLTAMFGVFVIVQFRYFFGGDTNIGVEGFTYSEYARRGFGELVTAAFFTLVLLLILTAVTRREGRLQQEVFTAFAIVMVALVTVMLVSAYQRLALYEAAYGFSRLRTYTNVFLVWIGILLLAVAMLQVLGRERLFATAALLAAIGFGATLALINVDAFIVRQNVNRALHGEALDTAYLSSLSTDSVPALAEIYGAHSTGGVVHEATGAVLACRLGLGGKPARRDWRSFSLSSSDAANALGNLDSSLAHYAYVDAGWPPYVVAPGGGAVYDCQGSGGD